MTWAVTVWLSLSDLIEIVSRKFKIRFDSTCHFTEYNHWDKEMQFSISPEVQKVVQINVHVEVVNKINSKE